MRTRSCITTRPAPRFRCPTSLLPICPSGSPTARPDASRSVFGARVISASHVGVDASAIALPSRSRRYPQPSRTTSTTGRLGKKELAVVDGQVLPSRAEGRGTADSALCATLDLHNVSPQPTLMESRQTRPEPTSPAPLKDRRRPGWREFRHSYPGILVTMAIALFAFLAIDAWLIRKRLRYRGEIERLRAEMTGLERSRTDALLAREGNRL